MVGLKRPVILGPVIGILSGSILFALSDTTVSIVDTSVPDSKAGSSIGGSNSSGSTSVKISMAMSTVTH